MHSIEEVLLTVDDLAERYRVRKSTIYKWNHYGIGPPYFRQGNVVRYKLSDVEVWEDGHTNYS